MTAGGATAFRPLRAGVGRARSPASAAASGRARLLLSYGVNDCEAKVATLSLDRVWAMLKPLGGENDVCLEQPW